MPAWRASPPAAFSLQQGPDQLQIWCAEAEPMQACADATGAMLDRFHAMSPGRGRPPPFTTPAKPATPLSVRASPDVAPSIWTQPSRSIDPTRLPLGNGRMVTDGPRQGYVFACDPFMYSMSTVIGAQQTGPWVDERSMTYDVTRKVFDRGRVEYPGRLSVVVEKDRRLITGDGLPLPGVPTGVFPVRPDDP